MNMEHGKQGQLKDARPVQGDMSGLPVSCADDAWRWITQCCPMGHEHRQTATTALFVQFTSAFSFAFVQHVNAFHCTCNACSRFRFMMQYMQ
jgi:hypothetical protein